MDEGLKSPHWPDVGGVGLIVEELEASAEELVPRVGSSSVLRRGPVAVTPESC